MDCEICQALTNFCLMGNPELKGYVMCNACIEKQGIVPIKFDYDPYENGESAEELYIKRMDYLPKSLRKDK